MTKTTRGILATLVGCTCWGFSGACGQYLFTNYDFSASWLTSVRMLFAGIILTGYGCYKYAHLWRQMLANKRDALQLVIFALLGLLMCQYTYLEAIAHSNAGTATVLQYLMPVFILLYVCCTTRRTPDKMELISVLLAMTGTFILATHGNPSQMVLTTAGLCWGLGSAVAAASYSLLPRSLMAKYGSIPVTGGGMLIGGLVFSFPAGVWAAPPALDAAGIGALLSIVVVGTVIAFTLYLQGIKDIGPVKASMLASAEPLSATMLAVIWLGTPMTWLDAAGFACIIVTVFILTLKK